ncbi:Der1-like family-domain-containing protein [Glomus cerebriforme]|uniref:Derlin n=1 Tax=Glomus cerebriforme TaxID=658196 RepID=A0A397TT78_9GLOM|nr:Der1-like family-domain-containing protein [Glomus cerebriforme]
MNRQQQRQPQNELVAWYNDIPLCTKFLFTSFVVITILGNTFVPAFYFFHIPYFTFYKLQIWRLYTSFFLHGLSLGGAFQLYFLYYYSREIETSKFSGKTADYVFFLLFEALTILILGWFFGLALFNQCIVMAIIYVWSQYYKDAIVTFMFGIRFKGVYLPFVLLVFEMLQIGGIPWSSIIGVITGHLYHYLQDIYPASGGPRLLNTPQWLRRMFPQNASGVRFSFGNILSTGRRLGSS